MGAISGGRRQGSLCVEKAALRIRCRHSGGSPRNPCGANREDERWRMVILHVHAQVRSEHLEAFRSATLENAQNSVREPGVIRFECFQESDEPTRFVLVEIYRDQAGVEAHRQSAHYAKWREAVEPMMAAPRQRTLLKAV